jgi:hypothetical protein
MAFPAVIDPRSPDLQRSRAGHQSSFSGFAVAHHEAMPGLVNQPLVSFDVVSDLSFEAGDQHPSRTLGHKFIK